MGSCCASQVEYEGSIFYKVMDIKMEKTGKKELDDVMAKADDHLEAAEHTRVRIANSFKAMTIACGTCVLKIPDLEQCIRAYLIRFLMELRKNAPTQGGPDGFDISKFDLHSLFRFSQKEPYLELDPDLSGKLTSTFKIDPNSGVLGEMKDAIIEFLKSLEGVKKVFDETSKEIKELRDEAMEFISKLDVKDGVSELYKQVMIGKRNLQKILDMRSIILLFGEAGYQISETVEVMAKWYKDPETYKKFDLMAKSLVDKKIFDMKKIVWETTNEPKLEKFENWESSFSYRVKGQIDTTH